MASFAISIFLSAFLLFQMQPLVGKFLLPRFGGTPSVWAVCMYFFQGVLVLGYAYSHYLSTLLTPKQQSRMHLGLLALSFFWLLVQLPSGQTPLLPEVSRDLELHKTPALDVLWLLALHTGLPFLVLASTSPLLQRWLSLAYPAASPYRLYSLSNLGSLLALISYPFVVEPLLTLKAQATLWALGYCACLLFTGACALLLKAQSVLACTGGYVPADAVGTAPRWGEVLRRICLAACASGMLLATTNQLCQEVAVIPFLWIVPLSVYLVSFILCFEREQVYSRNFFVPALLSCAAASCLLLEHGLETRIPVHLTTYSLTLFSCCMVCHGELARMKPPTRYLTSFYLAIAAGGALGGAIVSLVAPWMFSGFWEFPLFLWLSCLLAVALLARDRSVLLSAGGSISVATLLVVSLVLAVRKVANLQPGTPLGSLRDFILTEREILLWLGCVALGLAGVYRFAFRRISLPARTRFGLTSSGLVMALAIMALLLAFQTLESLEGALFVSRNFFGLLTVTEEDTSSPRHKFKLRHGRIIHGYQFREAAKRRLPTSYFGQDSGIGMALLHHPRRSEVKALRIGVLGLGVGTIAAYGRPEDTLRFYEINPEVVELSQGKFARFSYLMDCPAAVEVILGDGRLSLERELRSNRRQDLDILAIDAFSSDAVPVHLLTREAVSIYLSHLRPPDGILAFQITNRYLNLKPVVMQLARHFGLHYSIIERADSGELAWENTWAILSASDRFFNQPNVRNRLTPPKEVASVPLWTDDYSNLFLCLK